MRLQHGRHLAYCTNIHRGETWDEISRALEQHVLAVRDQVKRMRGGDGPFAIGLRLSAQAARELRDPSRLDAFRRWLDHHECYVFTVNGFPYGQFHGTRVKEQVYAPDWTTQDRLDYTVTLFEILARILPSGVDGSVSTVPVSFKAFGRDAAALAQARRHLWSCVEAIESLSRQHDRDLHLGLEPEPLCTLETSAEAVDFMDQLRADRPSDPRLTKHLGINYDCCHLAIEYESAQDALTRLHRHGIRLSKVHLSNALRVEPTPRVVQALRAFADDTYFHQVIERTPDGVLHRYTDLPVALERLASGATTPPAGTEWRIHFHVPLHQRPAGVFQTTSDHVAQTLDWLRHHPGTGSHLEMETYTWEVLPTELKSRSVVDQLSQEYAWTLGELAARALA
ncbi:MAG: metabolite traffic protein EboE [Verrucomicrobiales bacterium]|nr:metabolite traffic protein EboE [Verrucomicrobiales bacterium]